MMKNKMLGIPYFVWMLLFIVLPIVILVFYACTQTVGGSLTFSLENLKNCFSPKYLKIYWDSIYLAAVSTIICLIIGYPFAYFISRMKPKYRSIFLIFIMLPTWMNFLLRTYSWMNILGKNGIVNKLIEMIGLSPMNLLYNESAVLLGMVYNFLPFMIYPIYSILVKIKSAYIDAAMDLGATPFKSFYKITLPLSVPGIITGITMVFMPAVSTFVITDLLGGGQKMFIGNLIQHQFIQKGDWNFGSALSIIMMAIILIAMKFMNKFDTTDDKESAL